jgi:hypothetical protein
MDCNVCLPASGILEVPVEAKEKHAANTSPIAAQPI